MFDMRSAFGSRVQTPLGPLKSGIPDSVEIPAPVSATIRLDAERRRRAISSGSLIHVSVVGTGGTGGPERAALHVPVWRGPSGPRINLRALSGTRPDPIPPEESG